MAKQKKQETEEQLISDSGLRHKVVDHLGRHMLVGSILVSATLIVLAVLAVINP